MSTTTLEHIYKKCITRISRLLSIGFKYSDDERGWKAYFHHKDNDFGPIQMFCLMRDEDVRDMSDEQFEKSLQRYNIFYDEHQKYLKEIKKIREGNDVST
jgi:hypothetical protein